MRPGGRAGAGWRPAPAAALRRRPGRTAIGSSSGCGRHRDHRDGGRVTAGRRGCARRAGDPATALTRRSGVSVWSRPRSRRGPSRPGRGGRRRSRRRSRRRWRPRGRSARPSNVRRRPPRPRRPTGSATESCVTASTPTGTAGNSVSGTAVVTGTSRTGPSIAGASTTGASAADGSGTSTTGASTATVGGRGAGVGRAAGSAAGAPTSTDASPGSTSSSARPARRRSRPLSGPTRSSSSPRRARPPRARRPEGSRSGRPSPRPASGRFSSVIGSAVTTTPRPRQCSHGVEKCSSRPPPTRLRVICTRPSEVTSATWWRVRSREPGTR